MTFNLCTIYAAGYHFLFEPSNEFSEVDSALPGGELFVVSDGNHNLGVCDSTGKLVLPLTNARIDIFNADKIMILGNDMSYSAFDLSKRKILYSYNTSATVFGDGDYYTTTSNNGFGVADRAGEQILPNEYSDVSYLGDGKFLVHTWKDGWNVSDGKTVIPIPAGINFWYGYTSGAYSSPLISDFSNQNWISASFNGKLGVLDKNFKTMIPFEYDDIQPSQNDAGYFIVTKDNKYGLVDQNNTVCVPLTFDGIQSIYKGYCLVQKYQNDVCVNGVIDITGNFTVPFTSDSLRAVYLVDDYPSFIRYADSTYPAPDLSSRSLRPYLKIQKEDKFGVKVGIIDLKGQTILPAEYGYLYSTASVGGSSPFIDTNAIIAVKDGKAGVITINGDIVVPLQYDGININYYFPNNYYKAVYFVTQIVNGSEWIIGAVNRQNERVAENRRLNLAGGTPDFVRLIEFSPEPGAGHQGAGLMYSFSPINGLINGVLGIPASEEYPPRRTTPESPVLNYTGGFSVVGDKLMYGASYKGRGTVVVFDDFINAVSPALNGWKRDISFTLGQADWNFNGAILENDVPPFLSNDNRVMAPVRVIAEALGASVSWNDTEKTEKITKDDKTLILKLDTALPNNMGTPVLKDDRLFLPVRYIAEYFGGSVSWDQAARTVSIQFINNSNYKMESDIGEVTHVFSAENP